MNRVDPEVFSTCFMSWVHETWPDAPKLVAIDGTPGGETSASGEIFGYAEITRQYHARYRLPVMHTETNLKEGAAGDEAVKWLWKEWANVVRVRNNGVPIVG